MTEHRDAGWLAQLAEKDRQIQAAETDLKRWREQIQENLRTTAVLDIELQNVKRQNVALQAAYEDTRDSLMRALAALAEHDARYRQQVQAKASEYHNLPGWP
jgi:chromosome segregation ATPase